MQTNRIKTGHESCAGQVMVEACIGLALMALAWILLSFTSFMGANHIRTAMASRHAAWLAGHGSDPADTIAGDFFYGNDTNLVTVTTDRQNLSVSDFIRSLLTGKEKQTANQLQWDDKGNAVRAKVSFGMSTNELEKTDLFPFVLMRTQVPFMPSAYLTNWLSVESQCWWPADATKAWGGKSGAGDALSGVMNFVLSEIGSALGNAASWIKDGWDLITKFF